MGNINENVGPVIEAGQYSIYVRTVDLIRAFKGLVGALPGRRDLALVPQLNGVLVEVEGGVRITATNRFIALQATLPRVPVEQSEAEGNLLPEWPVDGVFIERDTIDALLKTLGTAKGGEIEIRVERRPESNDSRVTVTDSGTGASFVSASLYSNYPKIDRLIESALNGLKDSPTQIKSGGFEIRFNPAYLAVLAKIPRENAGAGVDLSFNPETPNKAVLISAAGFGIYWRGIVMPIRK